MKHTPGPWKASILKGRILLFSVPEDGKCFSVIRDEQWQESQNNEQWQANAKLIAAAPELLEALKKLNEFVPPESVYWGSDLNELVESAIKKATA